MEKEKVQGAFKRVVQYQPFIKQYYDTVYVKHKVEEDEEREEKMNGSEREREGKKKIEGTSSST
jgi:hypothetical protein